MLVIHFVFFNRFFKNKMPGSADLQSEILKSITKLNAFDILSNDSCAGNIGNLFNYCSNNHVRKLLAWIKPDLELLLKNRTSGFTFLANLFKNGKRKSIK